MKCPLKQGNRIKVSHSFTCGNHNDTAPRLSFINGILGAVALHLIREVKNFLLPLQMEAATMVAFN